MNYSFNGDNNTAKGEKAMTKTCKRCNFNCAMTARWCPDCFQDFPEEVVVEKKRKCDCGRENNLSATWCGRCGSTLPEVVKKKEKAVKMRKCAECKTVASHETQTYCYNCNTDFPEKEDKAVKAHVVVELSISENYTTWGIAEAIRELVQNMLDEHDDGNLMEISWGSKLRGRLPEGHINPISLINYGSLLTRECLLMGGTSKRNKKRKCKECGTLGDSDQTTCCNCEARFPKYRGKHGEGFKVAAIVLLRNGLTIRMRVNTEVWGFFMEKSSTFGTEILKVKVSPAQEVDFFAVEIGGLTEDQWKELTEDIIAINPPAKGDATKVGDSYILKGEKYKGKVFSQGLFVEEVHNLYWGYDLYNLELDRDRKSASYSSINDCITAVMREALWGRLITVQDLMDLPEDCREQDALYSEYNYEGTSEFAETVAKTFVAAYGENAIPVASTEEVNMAGQVGMRGIIVPRGLRAVICSHLGKVQQKTKKKEMEAKTVFQEEELSSEEHANLSWAYTHLSGVETWMSVENTIVVEFYGSNILGTYMEATHVISLNRRILLNRQELFSTYLHEVAHKYGGDGTDEHRRSIERISAQVLINACEAKTTRQPFPFIEELFEALYSKSEEENFVMDVMRMLKIKLENSTMSLSFVEKRKLKGIINLLIDLL